MTSQQRAWAQERDRLAEAAASLGWPEELADLLAKQLKSPGAIRRMTSYLYQARTSSLETIVDEMLAISDSIEAWRERKESREALAGYSAWLNSETRLNNMEDE